MSPTCSSEPISFLRLERYLQGDVQPNERAKLETHLGQCGVCRQCYESMRAETIELLPLPLPVTPARERRDFRTHVARAWPQLTAAAIAAAGVMVMLWSRTPELEPRLPAQRVRIKGGELAIELVREHAEMIATDPTQFAPGDRFQVRVSCPPGEPRYWDVVVFQAGELFFPLRPEARLDCRNGVTLAGAFVLDGTASASVCVILDERSPLNRARLTRRNMRTVAASACVELDATAR
jgi:hypothetical protein